MSLSVPGHAATAAFLQSLASTRLSPREQAVGVTA
jgi:hypothetical protein